VVYQYQYANHAHEGHSHRVFLANNNCSFQGGWIEDAMQSAVNAAAAVLKVMENQGDATDFRLDPLFAANPFEAQLKSRVDALKAHRRRFVRDGGPGGVSGR
jgi:hypothetical protein